MILRITGRLFNIHVLDHEFLNRFSMILFLLMKYFYILKKNLWLISKFRVLELNKQIDIFVS
jgi:hypothetical protein